MGTIRNRNGKDLTEAKATRKRGQEYRDELQKNSLNDPDNHNGVVTHLELDILECKVKWALEGNAISKGSGGDGIPAELFQILNDAVVKVLHSMSSNLESLAVATGLERSIFIPIPKKSNTKECSNYHIIALISHASKIMSKGFKLGFISTRTKNFQM